MKGHLSITRFSSTSDMEISFRDELSGTLFLKAEISANDLMLALTGLGDVDIEFELYPQYVGKTLETKTEIVPLGWEYFDEKRAAVARFEVDGWKGEDRDIGNHHNRVEGGWRVRFHRYVDVKEGGER